MKGPCKMITGQKKKRNQNDSGYTLINIRIGTFIRAYHCSTHYLQV